MASPLPLPGALPSSRDPAKQTKLASLPTLHQRCGAVRCGGAVRPKNGWCGAVRGARVFFVGAVRCDFQKKISRTNGDPLFTDVSVKYNCYLLIEPTLMN